MFSALAQGGEPADSNSAPLFALHRKSVIPPVLIAVFTGLRGGFVFDSYNAESRFPWDPGTGRLCPKGLRREDNDA